MPALFPSSTPDALLGRGSVDDFTAANSSLQVICAWPVSGQYGPGSRVLYYVLIAACVFARKAEWLKNPCLAAALLFPAVAALHGIVLAALHQDGAVDMDVFGAFQLCSIGILVAPVTVTLSKTYFQIRGRNTIFFWTGLILAGLLSLTIEFYRISTTKCRFDDAGNPISGKSSQFPYGEATCGLVCQEDDPDSPRSPMRAGSASNIYVIPSPDILTFGAATLLAAACCIHALIWLASMSDKILQLSWLKRFTDTDAEERIHEPIAGTNGATEKKMRSVNDMIRFFLGIAAIPVFGGCGLAILIIGEINFFSSQVNYQTEPIASVGQWAPIVGTGLAVVGSLSLLLAADVAAVREGEKLNGSTHHCNCSHRHDTVTSPLPSSLSLPRNSADTRSHTSFGDCAVDESPQSEIGGQIHPTTTVVSRPFTDTQEGQAKDLAGRRKVAMTFIKIGNYLDTAARDWLEESDFKRGKAADFPEIPGERYRNPDIMRIHEQYNQPRDDDGNVTPGPREHSRSRSASFIGSDHGGDDNRSIASPRPSQSSFRSNTSALRQTSSSIPMERVYSEPHHLTKISSSPVMSRPARSNTLEVPSPVHGHAWNKASTSHNRPALNMPSPIGQSYPLVIESSETGNSSRQRPESLDKSRTSDESTGKKK